MTLHKPFIFALAAALLVAPRINSNAADTDAAASPAKALSPAAKELKELISRIQAKLKENKTEESDFADNLKEFDTLFEKHKAEKTDDTAQILLAKAMLYLQVFDKVEPGTNLLNRIKTDYPGTRPAKVADQFLAGLKKQQAAKQIQSTLTVGAKFPEFEVKDEDGKAIEVKDLDGKPLALSQFKGKVVLIDFWATWCGPCMSELPNVIKAYKKHHANGFEIVGVSLDSSKEKLAAALKEKQMTWRQYFDGKGWGNLLAARYGIQSIPATYLLDAEGKILAKDLRGEDLESAVAKALPGKP